LPNNIVEVAKVLLEAGAEPTAVNETLGLVCSGCIARECHVQLPLIDLLCDYGADPASALQTAAVHGEFEALNALVGRGARITLGVAAALGDFEKALRLLPDSDPEERHRALALASQFGHAAIVQALLDAGEDPDRYNPVGFHSHATPMHQAALAGHEGIVRLLVERGARVDLRDLLWQGTPAGWAEHEGHTGLSSWLRAQEERTATLTKSPGTGGAASRS
jgi:ankyrin repeat protein